MRTVLAVAAALIATLAGPGGAGAHPLGNFTVNRYSGIELSGGRVYLHFVLDLAEIPTFQEGDRVRRSDFAARIAERLVLRLDGERARLTVREHRASERPGAGSLPTLRFEAVYEADRTGTELEYRDTSFAARIGWKEVVALATDGATIERSDVPSTSASRGLRAYPKRLLESPLGVTTARVEFAPGEGPGTPPAIGGAESPKRSAGGFEALVSQGELGVGVVLVSLAIAMFWGAAHALTPGHGKAIVAGYLVGARGKPRHALVLGLVVTAAHTVGVFGLGLVTLLLSRFVVPERLYPWLTLVSGLLVVGVGASVLASRVRHARAHARGRPHAHDHAHGDDENPIRALVGVGVAAGLLPCPSALVVLLSAIALHRIGFGLALIVAFSAGLALTISAIGLLAVFARRAFSRISLDGPLVRALPAASAVLILAVGVGITVNSLPQVL